MSRVAITGVLVAALALAQQALAATTYYVRVRPAGAQGLVCKVAFDLSHVDVSVANRVEILSFTHDGNAGDAVVEGGPGYGDLVDGVNPAASTTLEGQFFWNNLTVPFGGLGTALTFRLDLTEAPAGSGTFPDEFAMYLVRQIDDVPYPTADGLGTDALFAIDITGTSGGDLSVFTPMIFIPPDTLALEGSVLEAPRVLGAAGRLRFERLAPNPARSGVGMTVYIPEPGGAVRMSIYDAAGRLVAEPYAGYRPAGRWTVQWKAVDSQGRATAAGIYLVEVRMNGQSTVRRVAINH